MTSDPLEVLDMREHGDAGKRVRVPPRQPPA